MMQDNIIGIDETRLDKLALEIFDYADKINKIFNQLQLLSDQTNDFFVSPAGDEFRKRFNSQLAFYQIVNQNILSYASDLVKVKEIYKTNAMNIADNLLANNSKIGGIGNEW